MSRHLNRYGTLVGLVLICAAFALARPDAFPTVANLVNVSQQMATLAILACGATFVMVIGEFDLSVGFVASWAGVMAASLSGLGVGVVPALALTLAVCMAIGALGGTLVARFAVPSFIATLALGTVVSGVSHWASGGASIFTGIPDGFKALARLKPAGVPVLTLWMVLILLAAGFTLGQTEFGRRLYAIGGNHEAARLAGVPVKRDATLAFAISGLLAGVTGLLLAARVGSVQHTMGDGLLLPAYAAVFLGTTAFHDGEPNVAGTLLGVAIIAVLASGLTILNVKPFYVEMLTGAIIIVAVLLRRAARDP